MELSKKRKALLKNGSPAQEQNIFSVKQGAGLFRYLEAQLLETACDNTLRFTERVQQKMNFAARKNRKCNSRKSMGNGVDIVIV